MDREVEMDAMAARVEMARRYEDVADGMQAARLLKRVVQAHMPAWLSGLPEGIEAWLARLRPGSERIERVGRLDAQRS